MPNRPATRNEAMMPKQITITGSAVASMETARPWITLVPWPVVEQRESGLRRREKDRREQHRRDNRHGIGLEQIGRHPGAVADVIADIVGDNGRVARIVLRDPGFDFADEIGSDIGSLREDTPAEPGEDRDQRCAETQP